jgi:hypothetical protein
VGSFILRQQDDLSKSNSTPQEDTRLEVPFAFLDETTCFLRECVHGMKAELMSHLDEGGVSE